MNNDVLKQAAEALELAAAHHSSVLYSDPPQSAWKYHRVSEKIAAALAAIKPQPSSANSLRLMWRG